MCEGTHAHANMPEIMQIRKKVSLVLQIMSLTAISVPLQNWSDSGTIEVNFQVNLSVILVNL